jgi:L-ascorbate metabolism protein UlaG (beta-lactamase superfamily)
VVISTHWHEDHLDPITIPIIARQSPATRFVMPPSAMARAISWGIPRSRIDPLSWGQAIEVEDVKILAVPARHEAGVVGWEVPDAMGVILEAEGLKIYNTGDTEYDLRLRALRAMEIDVFQGCINGVGGNMNAHEAALLAWQLQARIAIPMHHLLWATNPGGDEATLDPQLFAETYNKLGGKGKVVVPTVADEIDLGRE